MPAGRQVIQGYGNGGFRIAGTRHEGSCLVFTDRTEPWPVADRDQINVEALAAAVATSDSVEILLIGCGTVFAAPPSGLIEAMARRGVAVEWMDTGAACRTFNVLLAEDRPVAAALLAVP